MIYAKRILVVDDDKFIGQFFKLILERKGYLVDIAGTGKEALEKSKNESYDVALIDVMLPDANGLDLLKYIPSHTKKIVLSGTISQENYKRALDNSADAYLLKPVKIEKLLNEITEVLK